MESNRGVYIVETTVPITELTHLAEYHDLTVEIQQGLNTCHGRFFTESRRELLKIMRADDQIINADLYYWG